MTKQSSTLIIEPRGLVREALRSLMERHSHCVIGAVGSVLDINDAAVSTAPKVTILATYSAAGAASEVSAIKRLWPGTKIILLVEETSAAHFDMLTSQIDACMPLGVSPDVFLGTLKRVQETNFRILLISSSMGAPAPAVAHVIPKPEPVAPLVTRRDANASNIIHQLSDRELQILKDIARGHSNKMIARSYSLAESTVKVHMKSIMRKTRVANRTQAAIWAMENGYAALEKDAA